MKAKLSIKKTLSLIVALVMLLTMIPAGMISVGAAQPTIDLDDYDYATEYVIMNVEDWVLIATEAQDKDFSGITVKLGADLDFGGFIAMWDDAHIPASGDFQYPMYNGQHPSSGNDVARSYAATVPTLFNEFAGIFDGDGYTISNAKFEEGGIAKKTLDGAEIKNVNFDNVSCADFYDYWAYGIVAGEVIGSFWMENVHVTDSRTYGKSFNTVHTGSGGGMLGFVTAGEGNEGAYVGIMDCSIQADVSCGNYMAWGYGYGTGMIVGTVDANVDFEMSYCEVSGSLETIDWYAGVVGALYVGEGRTAAINDIKINGLTMYSDRNTVTDGVMSFGSLVGCISTYDNSSVTIDRITVYDANIYSLNANAVGGLIGIIQPLNSPAKVGPVTSAQTVGRMFTETVENVSIEISNIYIQDAFLFSENTVTGGIGTAGLIAQVGEGNNNTGIAGRVMVGEINIYNVYIGATMICGLYKESGEFVVDSAPGGIFFVVTLAETVTNVSNVIVDVTCPLNVMYTPAPENYEELLEAFYYEDNPDDPDNAAKLAAKEAATVVIKQYSGYDPASDLRKTFAVVVHGIHVRQGATGEYMAGDDGYLPTYVNASDIVTTLRGEFNVISWLNRKGGAYYNGEFVHRGDKNPDAPAVENTDGAIAQVRPSEVKKMVVLDEEGFLTKVTGALAPVAVQAEGDAIRFIGLAYVDEIASATATVVFKDADGAEVKSFTFDSVALLDGLTAVEGTEIAEYDAQDFYAKKFLAVTIKNIPAADYTVEWSFEYTTLGGAVVKSETAAAAFNADGSFEWN